MPVWGVSSNRWSTGVTGGRPPVSQPSSWDLTQAAQGGQGTERGRQVAQRLLGSPCKLAESIH